MKLLKIFIIFLFTIQSLVQAACITPGALTEVSGSPFPTQTGPVAIAFSPIASGNLFAATVNGGDNTVSVFQINQTSGFFTNVDTPLTGTVPVDIAFSPIATTGNLFAAVSNESSNTVSVFLVNQASGVFTLVDTKLTETNPQGIAFSPIASGNLFAAVANQNSNDISVYQVDQTSGVFTAVPGSPFPAETGPKSIAFALLPSGNLIAAVTNFDSNNITLYDVNQSDGVFTQIGLPLSTGTGPTSLSFSPVISGKLFAAVLNNSVNTVSIYSVNPTTGAFTLVDLPYLTGSNPSDLAFSPSTCNLFLGITNFNDGTISIFTVNQQTGFLTEINGSPFTTEINPTAIAYSPVVSGNLFLGVPHTLVSLTMNTRAVGDDVSVYKVCLNTCPSTFQDRTWLLKATCTAG